MQLSSTTNPGEQVLRAGHLDPQGDGHGGQEGPQVTTNLTGPYQCASLSAECFMIYLRMVKRAGEFAILCVPLTLVLHLLLTTAF